MIVGGGVKESTVVHVVHVNMYNASLTVYVCYRHFWEAIRVHIWFCSVASLSQGLKNVTSLDSPCFALSISSLEQGCICQSLLCAITSKPIILDSWG